jgi:SAM-dependent methyltransferase
MMLRPYRRSPETACMPTLSDIRYHFIKQVYGDHNKSATVRAALARLLDALPKEGALALNIGAGRTRLDPRVRNLEIEAGDGIDYVGTADRIPLPDNSVDLAISQEVFEHVPDPMACLREVHRVLKPGGKAYIQLPFVIGYHPQPGDYWRFTHEGLGTIVARAGLTVVEEGVTVGAGTGLYRILVEYCAILFSLPLAKLYIPMKAAFAILLYPLKWTDRLLALHGEARRISGGHFVICEKRGKAAV